MAVVGSAHIVVTAMTAPAESKLKNLGKESDKTLKKFNNLQRSGYVFGTIMGEAAASVSSLVSGVVSLGSVVAAASPAVVVLGEGLVALGVGAATAKLALSGVAAAVQKANKNNIKSGAQQEDFEKKLAKLKEDNIKKLIAAQKKVDSATKDVTNAQEDYNTALKEGAEYIQQLGFDAEDAALAEKKAAMELEQARESLARVQDLPPNSRARREALLAYQEADLNLRRAKDRNADLRKEQDKLAEDAKKVSDEAVQNAKKSVPNASEDMIRQLLATKQVTEAQNNLTDATQSLNEAQTEQAQTQVDALRAEQDLIKTKGKSAAAGAADDPYAGLTKSQKVFAQYLVSIKSQLDGLKEAAASGFLPSLQTAIDNIVKTGFPVLKTGLNTVGTALGEASKTFSSAVTDANNLKELSTVFSTSAGILKTTGKIAADFYSSILDILVAAAPLTKDFFDFISDKADVLKNALDVKEANGSLTDYFNQAGEIAKDRKSTRLNSSHIPLSRMPSSA